MPTPDNPLSTLAAIATQAMRERGLEPEFSAAALQQAAQYRATANAAGAAIRDMRSMLWSSIDNDESRDLDQIEVAESLPDGSIKVYVAIADVDAAVGPGTPVDVHARTNTTSVYTAAKIFPMLPERLSTDLTSLAEDQERLAIVFEMAVGPDGAVTQSDIYRALVVNRAKLAYPSVAAWLEGTGAAPTRVAAVSGLVEQLRTQDRAAQAMRGLRHKHGALNLESSEATAVIEDGLLVDMRPEPKNRAQELIEDLMIAANGVCARFLQAQGRSSIRRVLKTPKRWDRIVAIAKDAGDALPADPDGEALSAFLDRRRAAAPDKFADLSLSVIKSLGSGEYALERPGVQTEGHFGLAVRDYTHSTAPNRRFPDVITQRLLKAALAKLPSPYSDSDLQSLAAHCTEQEDNAARVERQVRKSAAAMLLESRVGESFDGIVTGVSDKGVFVRVSTPAAEGRVVRGYQGMDVGERVRVQLVHTDVARGFIDFVSAR